jgi:hypothetical protein
MPTLRCAALRCAGLHACQSPCSYDRAAAARAYRRAPNAHCGGGSPARCSQAPKRTCAARRARPGRRGCHPRPWLSPLLLLLLLLLLCLLLLLLLLLLCLLLLLLLLLLLPLLLLLLCAAVARSVRTRSTDAPMRAATPPQWAAAKGAGGKIGSGCGIQGSPGLLARDLRETAFRK